MARDIMSLFMRFNQFGVSVLVATHAVGLISKLPYRVIHLEHGGIDDRQARNAVPGTKAGIDG